MRMDFELTDEQRLIQETVRDFVDARVLPNAIENDINHHLDLEVIEGMAVVDALYAEYGETSGGGIRGGKQGPLFAEGNAYLGKNYPKLDWVYRATVVDAP